MSIYYNLNLFNYSRQKRNSAASEDATEIVLYTGLPPVQVVVVNAESLDGSHLETYTCLIYDYTIYTITRPILVAIVYFMDLVIIIFPYQGMVLICPVFAPLYCPYFPVQYLRSRKILNYLKIEFYPPDLYS